MTDKRAPSQLENALALAIKIQTKARDTLAGLDREMTLMRWPPETRSIMWHAVAEEALRRSGRPAPEGK